MITVTKRENGTKRVRFFTEGASMTEQSHKKRVNINTIIAKYRKTGFLEGRVENPSYGDFTGTVDFHEANNRILSARKEFQKIPSDIRKRFHNDVGELLEFLNNPENRQEAIEIGLLNKEPAQPEIVQPEPNQEPEQPKEGQD